jgi:uncharacterized protein (TIGR02186 family)
MLLALFAIVAVPAAAEDLIAGLSQDRIQITSSYSGTDITVFGAIENASNAKGRDVVVVIRGPSTVFTARRKTRVAAIWVNSNRVLLKGMPGYYFLASTHPIEALASQDTLDHYDLGLAHVEPADATTPIASKLEPYRQAVIRAKERQGLYTEQSTGIEFLGPSLFRLHVAVPATVPRGQYQAEVYLVRDGAIVSAQSSTLFVDQAGLERRLFNFAHNWPLTYGVSAVVMSLLLGWLSSVVFRQNS